MQVDVAQGAPETLRAAPAGAAAARAQPCSLDPASAPPLAPTLPEVRSHLENLLKGSRVDRRRLNHLVRSDPVYALAVLRATSRASLEEALTLLATPELVEVLLGVPIFRSFDPWQELGMSARDLWRHAVATGLLARSLQIRKRLTSPGLPDAYLAGLLVHLGWIALDAEDRPRLRLLLRAAGEEGGLTVERERELTGGDHGADGGRLLAGLDVRLARAVAHHHEPRRAGTAAALAGLVRMATSLAPVELPLERPHEHPGATVPHRLRLPAGPLSADEMRLRYRRRIEAIATLLPRLVPWLC